MGAARSILGQCPTCCTCQASATFTCLSYTGDATIIGFCPPDDTGGLLVFERKVFQGAFQAELVYDASPYDCTSGCRQIVRREFSGTFIVSTCGDVSGDMTMRSLESDDTDCESPLVESSTTVYSDPDTFPIPFNFSEERGPNRVWDNTVASYEITDGNCLFPYSYTEFPSVSLTTSQQRIAFYQQCSEIEPGDLCVAYGGTGYDRTCGEIGEVGQIIFYGATSVANTITVTGLPLTTYSVTLYYGNSDPVEGTLPNTTTEMEVTTDADGVAVFVVVIPDPPPTRSRWLAEVAVQCPD